MTAAELQARVLKRLDDDPVAPGSATPTEVMAALNEGQELCSWLTLCLEAETTLPIPATSPFVQVRAQLPDYLVPLRLEIAGTRLRPATLRDLDALDEQWQATPGNPTRYVPLGFNLLVFTPQPIADTNAQLIYARSPVQMVGDDFPEVPEYLHPSLEDYAIYRVKLKEGAQGLARGSKYLARALDAWTDLGEATRARSRAAHYDTLPFELKLFDRSRLTPKEKKAK